MPWKPGLGPRATFPPLFCFCQKKKKKFILLLYFFVKEIQLSLIHERSRATLLQYTASQRSYNIWQALKYP
jgi:hypothetical protein